MDAAGERPSRPYALVGALTGLAGFAFLALFMWHSTRPTTWERPIITTVDRIPIPFHGFWISMFQPAPFVLMTAALTGVAAARRRLGVAAGGLAGCAAAILAAEFVFKPAVDRVRTHIVGFHHVIRVGSTMFPSVHVTAAAALATFAWLVVDRSPRAAPFLVALPLVVAGAAISEQLHYPADVIGGMLLGSALVYCTVTGALALVEFVNSSAAPAAPQEERA